VKHSRIILPHKARVAAISKKPFLFFRFMQFRLVMMSLQLLLSLLNILLNYFAIEMIFMQLEAAAAAASEEGETETVNKSVTLIV